MKGGGGVMCKRIRENMRDRGGMQVGWGRGRRRNKGSMV
jgi:hypothetical protein